MAVPSREKVLENVLRGLSRRETPLRYVTVQKLRGVLYNMTDDQYEEYYRRLQAFDPTRIDPEIKKRMLSDVDKYDESGALHAMVEAGLESTELLNEAKRILTDVSNE